MTYRHRNAVTITTVALSAMGAGFVMGNIHAQRPLRTDLVAATPAVVSSEAPPAAADHAALAFSDMHAYALRHLGVFEADVQSLESSDTWSALWRLYWMDVAQGEEIIRIYHVIDNADPRRRFTTMWVGDEAEWETSY